MLKQGILASILFSLLVVGHPALAQFSTQDNPVSVILVPEYPHSYETVTISPRSSLIDLTASTVTVSANGVVIQKGTGTQSTAITVGAPGTETKVVVSVVGTDGQKYSVQTVLRPADVSLIVEPNTTTHPFYAGLPLVAPEGVVRLVAIPDIRSNPATAINPASLIYTWKLGNKVLQDASGIGRSVLVASAPVRYRQADITLTVTSSDSRFVAEAKTTIDPSDPIVRLYPYDPLLGPDYDHAITGTYTLPGTEETFRAVPYFFKEPPALEWSVGGVAQTAQRDITVRSSGTGAGTASLEVSARIPSTLQLASNRVLLRFGEGKSPFSIFGF